MRRLVATVAAGSLVALLAMGAVAGAADVAAMLAANDVAGVDELLNGVQKRFEEGAVTEIDLRNAFRPIYDLTPTEAQNLHAWAASHPTSYAAHLAEGIYFKKRALAARGDKYISETSKEALEEMSRNFGPAKAELTKSRDLTKKPYLSLFHLLDVALYEGNRAEALALLTAANEILPKNSLARNRYAMSLMPRWGGSYPDVEAFIVKSKSEGLDERGIMQLQAILHDDKGHTLEERGDHAAARAEFVQALDLGRQVGGTVQVDFLKVSRIYVCSGPDGAKYCQ